MVCLGNMCMATLNKGDNDAIVIIIIIIIIISLYRLWTEGFYIHMRRG